MPAISELTPPMEGCCTLGSGQFRSLVDPFNINSQEIA
jgi:hypothetical protein